MTINVSFTAHCDYCPRTSTTGRIGLQRFSYTKTDFIKLLRANGWSYGKRVTCPECRAAGRNRRLNKFKPHGGLREDTTTD